MPRILIIEDDDLQYEIYEEALSDYELVRSRSGTHALARIPKTPPDLVILDHILEQGELGMDILPTLKDLLPCVPVIVVSGAMNIQQQLASLQGPRRAHYCLPKPVDIHTLRQTVETALSECGAKEAVRQFEAMERTRRVDSQDLLSRSTDRLSRQNQMYKMLKDSSDRPNISSLARQFNVARRTIIRDLQEMIRRGQLPAEIYPEWERPEDGD
jgi:DNA-binding NtrC family response regulator